MRKTFVCALCLVSALFAAACDRGPDASVGPAAPPALSAREIEDGLTAIDTLLEADRPREAEIIARKLLERSGGADQASPRVVLAVARALLSRSRTQGEPLKRAERTAFAREAAELARRAIEADDADVEQLRFAALAASTAGAPGEALTHALRALGREPDHRSTLFLGATAALAATDLAQARTLIERHARAAPDDPWSAGLEARLALAEGDASRAIERATAALSQDRGAIEFKLILARALVAGGRAADAVRMLAALPVPERSLGPVAQVLAEALDATGDREGAARAWDPALFAAPQDAAIRAEAALAFLRAGDRARAETELQILASLDGGAEERARVDARLRQALESLEPRGAK